MYGFRKVYYFNVAVDYSNGRQETVWQFKHPHFKKKNTLNDLLLIRRKTSKLNSTPTTISSADVTISEDKDDLPSSLSSSSSTTKALHMFISPTNTNSTTTMDHDVIISKIEKKLEETQHQFEIMKIEAQRLKNQQLEHQKVIYINPLIF